MGGGAIKKKLLAVSPVLAVFALCLGLLRSQGGEAALLHGTTIRVSVASSGAQANHHSWPESISRNGRFVAIGSDATNLVGGDTNLSRDVFVHDTLTGVTTRVSIAQDGTQADSHSHGASLSARGRCVSFRSRASNLIPGETMHGGHIYARDNETRQVGLVSKATDGAPGNEPSGGGKISSKGRYVAFHSWADNLVDRDMNDAADVFVHDLWTGLTSRLSIASNGREGNDDSYYPSISASGRYVAFESRSTNLVKGDTNDYPDIFFHDRDVDGDGIYDEPGATATIRISVSSSGREGDEYSRGASISANGEYVAFVSKASNLVHGDHNDTEDVFIRDLQAGKTFRVSVGSNGSEANDYSQYPSVSAEGRYVAFSSFATNLVSGDTNGLQDVFVHDRQTRETSRVSLSSSGAQGNDGSSSHPYLSGDGTRLAFQSGASNLVQGDTNGCSDGFLHILPNGLSGFMGSVPGASAGESRQGAPSKPIVIGFASEMPCFGPSESPPGRGP